MEIEDALKGLLITTTTLRANSRWSKFIVHGIPTTIGEGVQVAQAFASALQLAAPTVTLVQPPRWLATPTNRANKTHSSMVIALPAKYTMATLRFRSLPMFNRFCLFDSYVESSRLPQCRKCQTF